MQQAAHIYRGEGGLFLTLARRPEQKWDWVFVKPRYLLPKVIEGEGGGKVELPFLGEVLL